MRRFGLFFLSILLFCSAEAKTLPGVFIDLESDRDTRETLVYFLSKGFTHFLFYGIPSESHHELLSSKGAKAVVALVGKNPTNRVLREIFESDSTRFKNAQALFQFEAVTDVIAFWCPRDAGYGFSLFASHNEPASRISYARYVNRPDSTHRRFHEVLFRLDDISQIAANAQSIIIDTELLANASDLAIRASVFTLLEEGRTVFVSADWLTKQLKADPLFGMSSATPFDDTGNYKTAKNQTSLSFISVLLSVIWFLFALHFFNDPTYRKSISRFFFNHSFHANDVFSRNIRLSASGWLVAFQSMVLVGLVVESLFQFVVSPAAHQILTSNVGIVKSAGGVTFGYFFVGFFAQALVILISIGWLRFALPKIQYVSQILPIYAWTFHVHLVVIPLIIVLCVSGSSLALVIVWGVLLLTALALLSFYIVAWDYVRRFPAYQKRAYTTTIIPFTTLLFLGYFYLFYFSGIGESIFYAASLP